jgi:hypothetical protein
MPACPSLFEVLTWLFRTPSQVANTCLHASPRLKCSHGFCHPPPSEALTRLVSSLGVTPSRRLYSHMHADMTAPPPGGTYMAWVVVAATHERVLKGDAAPSGLEVVTAVRHQGLYFAQSGCLS